MLHLADETLIGYAEETLREDEAQMVRMHVEGCSFCRLALHDWQDLIALLKASPLEDAPEYAIRNCIALYNIPAQPSVIREALARIVFNSLDTPLTAGLRGSAEGQQILFSTDNIDIHLQIFREKPLMLGQILERSNHEFIAGARVGLLQEGELIDSTLSNSLGEFRFTELPRGHVQLYADLPSKLRVIARFTMER
jgi:hypothetical protein